jgi:hypothetical protein
MRKEIELARMIEDWRDPHPIGGPAPDHLGVTALNDLAESLLRGQSANQLVLRGLSDNDETELKTVRDAFLDQSGKGQ